jgi:hypothetical protein
MQLKDWLENRSTPSASDVPATDGQRGMALVTGILVLLLASSLLAGFLTVVTADSKLRGVDRARTQSFYAAYAGLEKLTADLGNLFLRDYSPEPDDLDEIEEETPLIDGMVFDASDGLGYNITFPVDANGDPQAVVRTISAGPFEGLRGLVTSYTLTATARTPDGAESRVTRDVNTVALPVFQFGIFSETDITFSANQTFNFGGRVHTNGNLWLTAASGGSTTLADRVTVVKEVIRTHLANGRLNDGTHEGTVSVTKSPGITRVLAETEGSLVNTVGSALNDPTWTNLSIGTYNGYIRNSRTGAKRLDLPFVSLGATPVDLIRRPTLGEDSLITEQRLFSQAGIRILLSDAANDITDLPGVSAGTTPLTVGVFNGVPLGATDDPTTNLGYRAPIDTPIQGGFLKIEYRNAGGTWVDVTNEWLNLGFTKRNIDALNAGGGSLCPTDPRTPGQAQSDAIIRFQRVRATPTSNVPCGVDAGGVLNAAPRDYWPLALYNVRESYSRDNLDTNEENAGGRNLYLGGVIHYIELDVNNLRRWLAGIIAGSGANVVNEDGFTVYFSDRRNNRDAGGNETGEYGWEDFVNPGDPSGNPNGLLDDGEDVNGNETLDVYGGIATTPAAGWVGWEAPLTAVAGPRSTLTTACRVAVAVCPSDTPMNKARSNPAILFRRALKLVNGALGSLPADGLTVASENPVYVEGHYNANAAGFGANAPASIMADAITLLSINWTLPMQAAITGGAGSQWYGHGDTRSFNDPNDTNSRPAGTTRYRFAALSGKIRSFTQLGLPASFGTDGGVHNFLRLTEDWDNDTLHYMGAIASFFYSRQNVGLFRCCTNVYELPARSFSFDVNFLTPSLLPPKTPMFRDVNTTRFRHVTRQ